MKASSSEWRREPAVAGRFYPDDPGKLRTMVEGFLAKEPDETPLDSRVIFAPHAGYVFSGRFAGRVYRRVRLAPTVFLLCPNHTGRGRRVSVWSEGEWITPLGALKVDELRAQWLRAQLREVKGDRDAHLNEHAIEVHLPFVQLLRPDAKIVPVVLGPLSLEECRQVGEALGQCLKENDATLVASTDMSHYVPARIAKSKDDLALHAIREASAEGLYHAVAENDISMCGFIPTTAAITAARAIGATRGEIVAYGHSGEVTKDLDSVVAYAAGALLK